MSSKTTFGVGPIKVTLNGDKLLKEVLDRFAPDVRRWADEEIHNAALSCQRIAKRNCPVDTGRLRSSIRPRQKAQGVWEVYSDVEYAWFVENGHKVRGADDKRVPGKYFLRNAYNTVVPRLQKRLQNLIANHHG